jgi:hypothetical protein
MFRAREFASVRLSGSSAAIGLEQSSTPAGSIYERMAGAKGFENEPLASKESLKIAGSQCFQRLEALYALGSKASLNGFIR